MGKITATGAFLLALFFLGACSGDTEPSKSATADAGTKASGTIELGDLPALKKQGMFRILVHRSDDSYLPRDGMPVTLSQDRLEAANDRVFSVSNRNSKTDNRNLTAHLLVPREVQSVQTEDNPRNSPVSPRCPVAPLPRCPVRFRLDLDVS